MGRGVGVILGVPVGSGVEVSVRVGDASGVWALHAAKNMSGSRKSKRNITRIEDGALPDAEGGRNRTRTCDLFCVREAL